MGSLMKRKGQRFVKSKPVAAGRVQRRSGIRKGLAMIPQELKYFDTAVQFAMDDTCEVPATGQWALIPQGDTKTTRDGRQAIIKSIQFRGMVYGDQGATQYSCNGWLWVVQDTQANGAAAAVTDVFTSAAAVDCLRNLDNNKRFKILHKEVFNTMDNGSGAVVYNTATATEVVTWRRPIEFYLPCNILVDWSGTTGAITEITSNNIFIISGSYAGDDKYEVRGNARLRFVG